MTIPNYLTLFRIFLVPIFVIVFYLPFEGHYMASAVIFAIAGFSDFFDGYLARVTGQTSALGAFLDPVADKLIVVVALVLLTWSHNTNWLTIPAMFIVGREIIVSALREWMAEMGKKAQVSVNLIAKGKTVMQMVAITGLLANQPAATGPDFTNGTIQLAYFFFYFSLVLTLWTMVMYLKAAWPHFDAAK